MCKSDFLFLTQKDWFSQDTARDSCKALCYSADTQSEGGGPGPWGCCPHSNFLCVWVHSARERSCEKCLCWLSGCPPRRTVHRPVLKRPRSRGSNWEHRMHCNLFAPTSKRSFYGQTRACLLFKKLPVENLTSLDPNEKTGDPLREEAVVKVALFLGSLLVESKTKKAFSLRGHRHCLGSRCGVWCVGDSETSLHREGGCSCSKDLETLRNCPDALQKVLWFFFFLIQVFLDGDEWVERVK